MAYNVYPAVDNVTNLFPPVVMTALGKSAELKNTVIPMSQADRNNLAGAELWTGRLIFNTTTNKINRYTAGWYEIDQDVRTDPLTLPGAPTLDLHAATKKYVDDYRPYTGRNLARNGAMRISQRGSSQPVGTAGSATDGWLVAMNADATMVASQQTTSPPPGFRHYARQSMSTADAALTGDQYSHLYSNMEGTWLAFLEWGTANAKPITISFWVRTSIGGTYTGSVRAAGAGTSYVFTFTTTSNVWEYKTITIPGATTGIWGKDADAWGSLAFCQGFATTCTYRATTANTWLAANYIGYSSQTNMLGTVGATFDITGVQIEEGLLATPFEHKSYEQDLREAQRYFHRYTNPPLRGIISVSGTTAGRCGMTINPPMRGTPTVVASGSAMKVYDGSGTTTISGFTYNTITSNEHLDIDVSLSVALTPYRPAIFYNAQNEGIYAYLDLSSEPV